jgi:hypothetical protein
VYLLNVLAKNAFHAVGSSLKRLRSWLGYFLQRNLNITRAQSIYQIPKKRISILNTQLGALGFLIPANLVTAPGKSSRYGSVLHCLGIPACPYISVQDMVLFFQVS